MGENKRYYWLKLQENFFEDDTIDFIEGQENGEKYVLFYLKLCLKALKNEGKLIRYVGEMLLPYNDVGIAKLTRTDIDVVRSALTLFSKIGLIKKMDSGEIYLTQLNEMVGTETQKAKYMRQRRLEQKGNIVTPLLPECYTDIELDIDTEKDSCSTQQQFKKPTIKEIQDYCSERGNKISAEYFFDYYEAKGWIVGKGKMKDWKAVVRVWEKKNPAEAPKENNIVAVCEKCGHTFTFKDIWECPKCHCLDIIFKEKRAG
jgi:predicted phage replisome organizer